MGYGRYYHVPSWLSVCRSVLPSSIIYVCLFASVNAVISFSISVDNCGLFVCFLNVGVLSWC